MSQMMPMDGGEGRDHRSLALDLGRRASSASGSTPSTREWLIRATLGLTLAVQCVLLLISLVPANEWVNLGQSPDGPIPHSLSWLVAGIFYVAPALIGALCRRWQVAVVLAALPAFLDLAIFAVAAASRLGPFYLAQDQHAPYTVGTLELFAALGALGWLARAALLLVVADLRRPEATPAADATSHFRTDVR